MILWIFLVLLMFPTPISHCANLNLILTNKWFWLFSTFAFMHTDSVLIPVLENKYCHSLIIFLPPYLGNFHNHTVVEISVWTLLKDNYPIRMLQSVLKCHVPETCKSASGDILSNATLSQITELLVTLAEIIILSLRTHIKEFSIFRIKVLKE